MDDAQLSKIETTWRSQESLKKIETNWHLFESMCDQIEAKEQKAGIKLMLDHFGARACVAPASSRLEFHNAFPGGFIDHSLRVMKNTIALATTFKAKASRDSLLIASLFHDWGKVGTLTDDYYINQPSDWHRKRGQMYVNNHAIKLSNAQLGLFNLSQFGVKLSEDEYTAILLNDGQYVDANKQYAMKEGKLAILVHMADRWSTEIEKNRVSLLDEVTT